MEPNAVYAEAQAVPTSGSDNAAMVLLMQHMSEQATRDRQAAASDREALAHQQFEFNKQQQQLQQQQLQQHQQHQKQEQQQQRAQSPNVTKTAIIRDIIPPDHCQHFWCTVFLGG